MIVDPFDLSSVMQEEFKVDEAGIIEVVPASMLNTAAEAEIQRLARLSDMIDKYNELSKQSGTDKWFTPGTPFGIDKLPKHRAFFEAGSIYNERLFMAANR